MRRRNFFGLCALAGALPTLASAGQKKPNVLFIISDDLNDNMGFLNHPLVKTPNIDRLAKQGLLFREAYTNFPLCGPSRNCFMSGLYPDQTGTHDLHALLRGKVPDVVTMSQHFMNNDYVAARVGKVYHYNNPRGIGTDGHDDPLSWNEKVNPIGLDKQIEDKIHRISGGGNMGAQLSWLAAEGTDEEHTDGIVATESIRLMNKYVKEGKPFFLGVGFYKPHTPYVAPKKYFDMYDKEKIVVPDVPEGYLGTLPVPAQKTLTKYKAQLNMTEEQAKTVIQAYYATITFMDAQVGRVLDALEKTGQKDNTIVLFTSDHGYHMGEHGYYQKNTLFQNSGRVPLIISAPGMKNAGMQTDAFVEMIDFYPTLSDLAGLPKPAVVSGVSQMPAINDPSASARESALMQIVGGYTLRAGKYRFTKWGDGGSEMIEFYDRSEDPEEMKNVAGNPEYRDAMAKMEALLDQRVAEAQRIPDGLVVLKEKDKSSKSKNK